MGAWTHFFENACTLFLYNYRNEAFYGRTCLAAIDNNAHAFRKPALTKSGKPKFNKVYSKRSKNWRVQPVKETKEYKYWPALAIRIMQKRLSDKETILRKVEIAQSHPKNIAPSIAGKPVPSTSDLARQSLSRFATPLSRIPPTDKE